MRVYVAGPLFTDAERQFNRTLADRLREVGDEVFLPQDDVPQDDGPGYPSRIFSADLKGLNWAEVVVAVCDGALVDDGTAWEIGFSYARGVPVIGLRTDVRMCGREEKVNLMIQQSVRSMAGSVVEVLARLEELRQG